MSNQIARSIVLTVAYSAQFGFPLTKDEIWNRLICRNAIDAKNKFFVSTAIDSLIDQKLLFSDGELVSVRHQREWNDRSERLRHTLLKLEEAQKIADSLSKIPWILAAGVTGSVAAANATENDDIDFILIIDDHHLWLARLWVTALAFLNGKRRSWNHEEENSWCFNLWLEKSALKFAPKKSALYIAYELCQVQWLFQKNNILNDLLQDNYWVAEFLPHYFVKQHGIINRIKSKKSSSNFAVWTGILNEISYAVQRLYMSRHMTRERVSRSFAFFHPRDTAGEVGHNWKAEIEQWSKHAQKRRI